MGTLNFSSNTSAYGNLISGSGNLSALSNTTLTLNYANTYTGSTTIDSGATLALSNTGSIATSSAVNVDGVFDIRATTSGATITTLSGVGSVLLGAQTLTLSAANDTFGGVISGLGVLVLSSGAETLTGTNTYTGGTTINGGTLLLGADNVLEDAGLVNVSGGTLAIAGFSDTVGAVTLSSGSITGTNGVLTGASYDVTNANGMTTISVILSGSAALTKTGAGTLVMSGVNQYTGGTAINSGILALNGNGSIATSSAVNVGGTFDVSATTSGATIKTLSGAGLVVLGAQTLTLSAANDTFDGVISGAGGLLLRSGAETLTGTNTFTGASTINDATLALSGTGSIATSSAVNVDGIFDISNTNAGASIKDLSGAGTVALGSKTLTITNGSNTFSGAITDGGINNTSVLGSLAFDGGTTTLSGNNTYTGSTSIDIGATLALSGAGSIAFSSSIANNGILNVVGKTSNVSLGGSFTQAVNGSLAMNISPSLNQQINIAGAASLNGSLLLSASPGSYASGRYTLLTANGGVTGTFSSLVSTLNNYTNHAYVLNYDLYNVYLDIASGPSSANTQTSLTNNLAALQGVYNLQTSIINNSLSYDCTLFDVHSLCISTGGRFSNTNTPTGDSAGALVIVSYRVNNNVRVGAYLDQGISSSTPSGINLKQHNPLFGAFAVWQSREDGLGAKIKVAAGYNNSEMTVTRAVVGSSEAGSGSTSLISQGVSVVGSYGVEMQGSWIASPYGGIRFTDVKADQYTEATSSSVMAPITYNSLSQNTASLMAGIRWSGKLTDRLFLNGSVGVEHDVSNKNSSYTATSPLISGLNSEVFNTDINKTRPVASAGTSFAIDKRQQLTFSLMYREEAFTKSSNTSAYGTYTIGF
jgi:autotransporter-associated beta strand protein